MVARGSVWTSAAAQLDLTFIEVFLELSPLLLGSISILILRAGAAAPTEEFLVVPDDVLVEHRDVASRGLEVQMAE
jgi:hypothetical protein